MLRLTCAKLRQGDEYYCSICHTRWEIGEEKPPCTPVELPVETKAALHHHVTKTRLQLNKKRAKRFRGK